MFRKLGIIIHNILYRGRQSEGALRIKVKFYENKSRIILEV